MKKSLLLLVFLCSFSQVFAQNYGAWKKLSATQLPQESLIRTTSYSENQALFTLDLNEFRLALTHVPAIFSGNTGAAVYFPNSNGELEKFYVWENSNFEPALQAQYPEIRSFSGTSATDLSATIRFSIDARGIQTMVMRPDNGNEFIEPYTKDNSVYVLFDTKTRNTPKMPFTCGTVEQVLTHDLLDDAALTNRASNLSYKTMRLALSCVAEYTTFYGGTVAGALGGMNATMTRVNGLLERDLALHLNIIANNAAVIYTNANTDPYSNGATGSGGTWNAELQNTLTSVIGEANYDIGHLFGASGGGGNAGCIGCVCVDGNKGSAFTSPSNNIPQGDTFDVDYVVHEMGHQLGGNHSFSHQTEGSGVNVEPGSGSTIMGYAGLTSYDIQNNSDAYFTFANIKQIQTNLNTKTCPVSTPITNNAIPVITFPVPSANTSNPTTAFTIPKSTPFILKGVVTDPDGDAMTYTWESIDSAGTTSSGANSVASPTKASGPNFRSFPPSNSPNRYMPAYASVLNGVLSTQWESVNSTGRNSKFAFTARDNHAGGNQQTNTTSITVTTSATVGPFAVTSQNTLGEAWAQGATKTITWDVNNANTLAGSANVNIKLSIDGGQTFPYTLASATPNDGNEDIVVPSTPASLNCRLMIEPTGNIFYAINSKVFYIGYEVVTNCVTYNFTGAAFNLTNGTNSWTTKTINVPSAGTVSDVNITVNATHTNLQNLQMAVIRPGGTILTYYNQHCTGNANMNATFDSQGPALACASPLQGTFAPSNANLNTLSGFSQQGNWQFGFKDVVAGADSGTINSFSIQICSQATQLLATPEFGFENFALYPNPNNGSFTVAFTAQSSEKIAIEVHDLSGRKIFSNSYANQGIFAETVQLENAQAGVYLVSITNGTNKIVKRIVKQ
jgi:subtilisin-like proprotein convertase family protein